VDPLDHFLVDMKAAVTGMGIRRTGSCVSDAPLRKGSEGDDPNHFYLHALLELTPRICSKPVTDCAI
jgi:hypothetical protein